MNRKNELIKVKKVQEMKTPQRDETTTGYNSILNMSIIQNFADDVNHIHRDEWKKGKGLL